MNYGYRLGPQPDRNIRKLQPTLQRQVVERIKVICVDPRDANASEQLSGRHDGLRRTRGGNPRILFYVDDQARVLEISYIGPRGDAYKGR